MIYAVTVPVDLQTLDELVPLRLMNARMLEPGMSRKIPGGLIVFQSAAISNSPGEPSLFRFVVQFGALRNAAVVGNWLFSQLKDAPVALSLAGHPIALDHHTIIAGLKQVA
jgi:hypothetical protein